MKGKVLLPCLGRPFGEALEAGELKLAVEHGGFSLHYFDRRFPISPSTWAPILRAAYEQLEVQDKQPQHEELLSVITHFQRLTQSASHVDELYREQAVAKTRLVLLRAQSNEIEEAITKAVALINGTEGDPKSFDSLEKILLGQHYRLAFWQVAYDEINYRRFFDINDLAAIRVEDPEVFDRVHQVTFDLLKQGLITGLRIDHPDGLLDPTDYFKQLQARYRNVSGNEDDLYILAEKILSGPEQLNTTWTISGTTGYDFLNALSAVLVNKDGVQALKQDYAQHHGPSPREAIYEGKRTILQESMSSEAYVLASRLFRLARSDRKTYDFTLPVLAAVLKEYIACFSV